MTNSKLTKRALLSSAIALFLCFAMLIGTTLAWFTDSVESTNNKIVAGTLDIELYQWNGDVTDGRENATAISTSSAPVFPDDILWEPGYTHVVYLSIKNEGSLALKYKVALEVTSVSEESLLDVMSYAITPDAQYNTVSAWAGNGTYINAGYNEDANAQDVALLPGEEHFFALSVHMDEDAGNEYQDQSIAFDIKVLAGQLASEEDSFGPNYDADAIYPVANAEELISAIENGADVTLSDNITLDSSMTVGGDVTIDLNGYKLDASGLELDRPFHMTEGASLTINGEDAIVTVGDHGLVNVPADVKNAEITLNGGTYAGETVNGALIRLRSGNENVNVTLNNVTYVDSADNGYIISTNGFDGEGELIVNGGSYAANYGFQIYGLDATLTNVEINTNGTGVEASEGANVVVDDCVINVDPGVTVVNAPGAGVAASHGGVVTIKNSTISGAMKAVYYVYDSAGTIIAENNNIDAATYQYGVWRNDTPANLSGSITIDGTVVSQIN